MIDASSLIPATCLARLMIKGRTSSSLQLLFCIIGEISLSTLASVCRTLSLSLRSCNNESKCKSKHVISLLMMMTFVINAKEQTSSVYLLSREMIALRKNGCFVVSGFCWTRPDNTIIQNKIMSSRQLTILKVATEMK